MEYQIGENIKINRKNSATLVVVEHESCYGCYFMYKCKHDNRSSIKQEYGECSCLERKDGKNIIFSLYEEKPDESETIRMTRKEFEKVMRFLEKDDGEVFAIRAVPNGENWSHIITNVDTGVDFDITDYTSI